MRAVLWVKYNGVYDRFVALHRNAMQSGTMLAHMSSAFLPWHRELLRRFEAELQRIDSRVTLPYWDWAAEQLVNSPMWSPEFLGGDGDPQTSRVTTGPFAFGSGRWNLTVTWAADPGPALRRQIGRSGSLPSASHVASTLAAIPYDQPPWMGWARGFRPQLEGVLHNPVHWWVGGSMLGPTAPNDPVFFLHHANVDRLWAAWQVIHPDEPPYLPSVGGASGSNLHDPMPPWEDVTPAMVINHATLGYSYDSDPSTDFVDLVVGGSPAHAVTGAFGEVDAYRFRASSGGIYTIETQGPTDVVMSLSGPNSRTTPIARDDGSGQARNARIESFLTPGAYFLDIRHHDPGATGEYTIAVGSNGPRLLPEIHVNGPAAQGILVAANESDLWTFVATGTALYTVQTLGNTDTFLTLFGPNSQTRLIAQDDDSGPGLNSRIVMDLAAGVYFLRIRHYDPAGTGPYSLAVTR